jgi:hypothetical protein
LEPVDLPIQYRRNGMSTTTTGKNSEEILLSVPDRLEEVQLPEPAPRLALCSHIHVPNKNEIDHLAEVEKVFVPQQAKKRTAKKAVRKPPPAKGKPARKKATKRIAV